MVTTSKLDSRYPPGWFSDWGNYTIGLQALQFALNFVAYSYRDASQWHLNGLYSLVYLEMDIPVEQTNTLEQIGILSYEVCRGQSSRFGLGTQGPTGRRGLHEADVLVDDVQKVQSSAGFEPQQRLFVLRRHVKSS